MSRLKGERVLRDQALWWYNLPTWGERGRVDCILNLLTRGRISNSKARELLRGEFRFSVGLPLAPWEEVNFDEEGAHSEN